MYKKAALLFFLINVFLFSATAQTAPRPPLMAWASWNNFGLDISETLLKTQADALVSSGLSKVGYNQLNVDDGFFMNRNAKGNLLINTSKFPKGMKALADYFHSKGLKAGMYAEAGTNTCGSIWGKDAGGIGAGLYGHDQADMDLYFKTWGFDFVKVDYCGGQADKLNEETRYTAIRTAIDNTGKKGIGFNICRWQFPGTWAIKLADSWRISQDINNSWGSITSIIDLNTYLAQYSSPGHYNDMDMLEVGRGLTAEEDKSHFSMWCILSSPLVLGNDLTKLTPSTKKLLSNTEVIAVNQDMSGQAHLLTPFSDSLQIWARPINGIRSNDRVVALFNRSSATATMKINWSDLNLVGAVKVRDLWKHTDLSSLPTGYSVSVPSHGIVMLKLSAKSSNLQEVFEAEYAFMKDFAFTSTGQGVQKQKVAHVEKITSASGGAAAISLGNSPTNWMEFRNIYTTHAGNYTLTTTYRCNDRRNMNYLINDKTVVMNKDCSSNSNWATRTNIIPLQKGTNTIRIYNVSGTMPDIDKIQIVLNK